MEALQQDELEILRCIERYQNRNGRTPSYEEVRQCTGMSSKDHVYRDVQSLERKGYLRCERGISRGIVLLFNAAGYRMTPSSVSVPILGYVAAGEPIPLQDTNSTPLDWIEITRSMLPETEDIFAVRVRGNSMIDALVNDGDTVVMKKQEVATNGELVAVRLKSDPTNHGITLKRFFRRNGTVWLVPENPELSAAKYRAGDVEVQGKVLCVIRSIPSAQASAPGARPVRPR